MWTSKVQGAELTMIAEDKDLELATLSLGVAATEETPAPPPEEPAAVAEAAVDPGLGRPGGRTIGAEAIKAVIDRNSGQVKACYERQLKSQPSLSGKVVVAWTIGADGRVRTPWVPTNSTGNRTLAGCVQRAVGAWRFPTAESPQDIEYPFVFKPRGF